MLKVIETAIIYHFDLHLTVTSSSVKGLRHLTTLSLVTNIQRGKEV